MSTGNASGELSILSAGAPKAGLIPCAAAFETHRPARVEFSFQTAPELRKSMETVLRPAAENLSGRGGYIPE